MINSNDNIRQVKRYDLLYKISMIALLISFVSLFIFKYPRTLYSFVSIISALVACTMSYAKKIELESIQRFEKRLVEVFSYSSVQKNINITDEKDKKEYTIPYLVEDESGNFAIDICYENGIIYLSEDEKKLEIDRKGTKKLKTMKYIENPNFSLEKAVKLMKKEKTISNNVKVQIATIFISDRQILNTENNNLIAIENLEKILIL